MVVGSRRVAMLRESDAKNLPWQELAVDVVIESSGHYTTRDKATSHLEAGARQMVISAPADGVDATLSWA